MSKFLRIVLLLSWGLWFGGLIAMLLFVTQLFGVSHDLGLHAAPVLFRAFAIYQIVVGLIACIAGTSLSWQTRRNCDAILSMVMILALGVAVMIRHWTVQMLAIIAAGESSGPQFLSLHITTNIAYTAAALLLVVAGIGWAITGPGRRTVEETAPEQGSPAAIAGRS